jgi:hypothetical protein
VEPTGENKTMRTNIRNAALCGLWCGMFVAAGCAQKKNDWAMQNALIGPESPIEVRAGSSYEARAMYPVPDGPLFPLQARVEWSIAPAVKGIFIDVKTGKISVEASVAHGVTATVHANVERGRRVLETKLYVFRPEENPFVGQWQVNPQTACGETQGRPVNGAKWKFHVSGKFWLGREMNIAAGTVMDGGYEYDLKAGTLKLAPTWPSGKPASSWNYLFRNDGKELLLRPLKAEDECSYVLSRP